ncbi:MAG TPA: RecX family transcriptional regulator [Spirochaetia bacterium]|nr:RecX family transcriptional regulator [Spirochaetia bacterium]
MVRIHLSDGSFFLIHEEVVARSGLAAGIEVTEEERQRLLARSERVRARLAALRLLARGAHTRRGLGRKLVARGFERDAIRHALARMVELGYCDDRAFAESWLRLRVSRGTTGSLALYRGLLARGVSKQLAQEVLNETYSFDEEVQNARRLAAGLSRTAAIRRLSGRGFRSRAIAAVLHDVPRTAPGRREE